MVCKSLSRILLPLLLVLLGCVKISIAFNPLKGVMPGEVAKPHAKLEDSCLNCHRLGSDNYQKKCIDCHDHKNIADDLRLKRGFHGKMKRELCERCHAEHKGRNNTLIVFDKKAFDHRQTELPLFGKHQQVPCQTCHLEKNYRAAETTCIACHQKEDKHEGSLGLKCNECHVADDWKKIEFNHGTTEFSLVGKHIGLSCKACHLKNKLKNTPKACVVCHKKEDKHKGILGRKCESCHAATDWKKTTFDHALTKFPLIAKHLRTGCLKCHRDKKLKQTPKTCVACHKKEDVHKGQLSSKCQNCHTIKTWKEASRFDHQKTRFKLLGKHRPAPCEKCHLTKLFTDTSDVCSVCHRKDDVHKGIQGNRCENCHAENDWKKTGFNHDKTTFPLLFKHRQLKCKACHFNEDLKQTPKTCVACHKKDDPHKKILGQRCAACHSEKDWKETNFDHNKTQFKLIDRHKKTKCLSCHKSKALKKTPKKCVLCHKKDDVHETKLGDKCQDCHDIKGWLKAPDFDHQVSAFPLLGLHKPVKCNQCHQTKEFKGTTDVCGICHKKEDKHKGILGSKCENCHSEEAWNLSPFSHNRTNFPLLDKHAKVGCIKCHQDKKLLQTPKRCIQCHKKDDVHQTELGNRCQSCHSIKTWKKASLFNHRTTLFPLLGKHKKTACKLCHEGKKFKVVKTECHVCHEKDDVHEGRFGLKCGACHSEKSFERKDFDHQRETGYLLKLKHLEVPCLDCHLRPFDARRTSSVCAVCHRRDDVHEGELGQRCELCHSESDFLEIKDRR